jgi:hypothetical protein
VGATGPPFNARIGAGDRMVVRRFPARRRWGRCREDADEDKDNARLIVSRIVLDTLEALNMHYAKVTPERHRALESIRGQLAKRESGCTAS